MPETNLICRAQHPDGRKGHPRYVNQICKSLILPHPGELRFTGRILTDWNQVERSERRVCLGARCPKCGMITEYEIVTPKTEAA